MQGTLRALAVAYAALSLAACASPAPLMLPWPKPSPAGSEIARASDRAGVPLADRADAEATEPQTLIGNGEFTGRPEPRRPAPPATAGDSVTLNLAGASIPAAAKAVLGDIMGVPYAVSEKVKGTVTIQTPRPVSRQELGELFESALQSQGVGVVVTGSHHRVLPLEEVAAAGAPIRQPGATGRNGIGVSSQIVQLKHVTASDMERVLKSVVPGSGSVRPDPARNILVLSGTRADIDSMLEAIGVFDVDQMRGMSFGLFPVEHAEPDSLAQELDIIFANDKESATKGLVRFVPNRRLKSILVISARPEHLRRADGWIRKFDIIGRGTEKQVHVYHVQNRPASELAALLRRVYQSQSAAREAGPGTGSLGTAGTAGATADGSAPAPAPPVVIAAPGPTGLPALPPLASALPGAAADPNRAEGTPGEAAPRGAPSAVNGDDRASGIGVVADEPNNALVITATASEYHRIKTILSRIDVAPNQLLIEATIAEITLTDELKMGLRWFFERSRSEFRLTDSAVGSIAPVFPGFSYFLNGPNIQVALNALASITDVNVVSSPTLMVMDNKKAILQIGDEVPVATQSAVSVLTPGAPIVNSITFRNTGIILGITPRISDRGRILLDIEQEVSEVTKTTTSNIDSPTIQQRRIKTTVAVADGESLILAGLMQDKASRERGQVPILGDLPLIGNLVKNKTDTIKRTELLIAMTPRIMRDKFQARHAIDEFRAKLNFSTRPQRFGPPDRHEQLERIAR